MCDYVNVKDFIRNARSSVGTDSGYAVEMVGMDDEVDTCYGMTLNYLTREDVEQLLNGKMIYFDDIEYAHLIYMRGNNDANQ